MRFVFLLFLNIPFNVSAFLSWDVPVYSTLLKEETSKQFDSLLMLVSTLHKLIMYVFPSSSSFLVFGSFFAYFLLECTGRRFADFALL
jgi:hypothetical protein